MTDHVRAIAEVAASQHGLLTRAQATAALGDTRAEHWVRAGRLQRVQPNVVRVAGSPETWHQLLLAAQLSADGVISHRSAAALWGLVQTTGAVDVSIRAPRRATLRPPALVHRIKDLHPSMAVSREGLRLTDPIRTLVDLGLAAPNWVVARALRRALTTKLVVLADVEALREALGRPGRNGTGVLRKVIEDRRTTIDGEESELESRFIDLLRRHGVPLPALQVEVWTAGRFVARLDAAYLHAKLAIELDGFAWHSEPDAFQYDRERQNELTRLGWTVLRYTWADVTQNGRSTVAQIVELLARTAA